MTMAAMPLSGPSYAFYALAVLFGYLIGSLPTGYLVVRQMTGQDIRTIGSGSTGATNVRRVAGSKAALFVLLVDFHKGLVPVVLGRVLLPQEIWLHVLLALAAVIGHSKSVFLRFRGGKSAATGLGTLLALSPVTGLLMAVMAYVIVRISRYQSVGSISASVAGPLILTAIGAPAPYIVYGLVAATYVVYLHRENIRRLARGTENRL